MVHDPRVTTLLSRLGGLYRDPSRVDRDAASLLKSSVGEHLKPSIASLVENNGDTSNCMVLQGTIAIVFRGNTYQLLVDIFLPPGYPSRAPVSYVRLVQNMYLKENHPHVGRDGMVYMPYLHEWNFRTHTLIEMVVAMSSIFSQDPPVFSRSTPPPPPPPPPPPAQPTYLRPYVNADNARDERYMQEQLENMMLKEAEEASAASRRAELRAQEEERARVAKLALDSKRKDQIRDAVNQKMIAHLQVTAAEAKAMVQSDWRDQYLLKQSKVRIQGELDACLGLVQTFEETISIVDKKTMEIGTRLEEMKNSSEESVPVDDLCQPESKLQSQLLDLASENAAITDALYFLDRGMFSGHIDCTTHLKSVRKLAKRQFLIRAHILKINQALMKGGRGFPV